MDESGCFFKTFSAKDLAQKVKEAKGGKKSNQRVTVVFFVSVDGRKFGKPTAIWRGKNVILFLDNATVHPTSLIDMYSNIKIILLCFPSKEYNVTFAAA